jgi:hypothetical protein
VAGDLALRWSVDPANPKGAVVEFSGLDAAAAAKLERELTTPAQWQTVLTVRAEPDKLTADSILPAMAGSYRVDSGKVRFTPLFPLAAGVNYVAVLNSAQIPGHSGAPLSARHRIPPSEASAATVVTHIYPSAAILPENLLKFYVHFSAPMSKGRYLSSTSSSSMPEGKAGRAAVSGTRRRALESSHDAAYPLHRPGPD